MRPVRALPALSALAFFVPALAALHLLAQAPSPTPAQTHPWTVKEIYAGESLTGAPPEGMSWSPDGRRATYIDDNGSVMEIQAGNGGLHKLIDHSKIGSLLDAAITEKDRDHRNRYDQPDYIWSPDSSHLLFDTNGELWMYNLHNGTGTEVGNTGMQSGDDPKFSPNGQFLSYVREHNLYVQRAQEGGAPVAITQTHDGTVMNGEIDWVYLEELNVRSNYFWSPDSRQLAYLQMNEAAVPTYPITDWIPTHSVVDPQRYPQPGDPNPAVRVGVASVNGGSTRWLRIPLAAGDDYVPRFGWVDPRVVWVEVLTRDHKHMNLYFADTHTGEVRLVLAQTEPKYFTMTYDVAFAGDGQFLVLSWRDGFTHIYLYRYDPGNPMGGEAQLVRQLESGPYEVESVKAVDEASKTVFYLSSEGDAHEVNPLEQQVWAIQLDGSGKRRVTRADGVHDPDFAPRGGAFIDTASTGTTPPTVSSCTAQGDCTAFWTSHKVQGHTLIAPERLELKAADGATTLYGTLQLPANLTAAASVPLIVNPYGGPGVGTMKNAWHGKSWFFDQLLAEHGFAVLHVDNRGMAGRGRDFEQAAYHNFGPPQFADQMTSIDQVLARYPQLDPHRLGWWGWSWGGSFTLYSLTHTDRFLAGASGAPVTDWRNYDSTYTERYLGLPAQNPEVYRDQSVVNTAKDLKGHILILHGTGDDNVHFANTVQYIQKLIDAGIPYDYNIFPRKTHSVAGAAAQTELRNRLLQHFEMYVKNPKPEPEAAR